MMEPNWMRFAWVCLCLLWLFLFAGLALVVWFILRSKTTRQPAEPKPEPVMAPAPVVTPEAAMVTKPAAEPAPVAPKLEPAVAAPPVAVKPDDLEKIEGIGPKIAKVLQEAGVTTFAALAATSPEQLRAILDRAGIRRISDPATWPEQARLAAEGKWQDLEAFQATLKAGRRAG